jgi:hypothetical protein
MIYQNSEKIIGPGKPALYPHNRFLKALAIAADRIRRQVDRNDWDDA